jgi:hypothetical protein
VEIAVTNPTYRGAINIVGRRSPATGGAEFRSFDGRMAPRAAENAKP